MVNMDHECLLVSERLDEVTMMCPRENPIYEHVSSFGIALYVLGFFNVADVMSFDDVDASEAANILKEHFIPIREADLPSKYHITESRERYLLVLGDKLLPIHFAVLVSAKSDRIFFSKLKYFGSGFDRLEELLNEFQEEGGITYKDIHFYKMIGPGLKTNLTQPKIYIIKRDGSVV
jgi:hypothetical protein